MLLLVCSCLSNNPKEASLLESAVPKTYVLSSSEGIQTRNDVVYLNAQKYSGFLYEFYPNTQDTLFINGYLNGLLHGVCKKWYAKKQIMEERIYRQGAKHGKQVAYWENGNKKFEFIAQNDAYEGELKEWTFDNKLIHLAHFKNGQEEGTQKSWYDNGKIRANYVIINGRRYGLLGTKNCKNVSDSIFVVK
ncbi:toxin-antitoxin system YwqK family antitoxin [Runella aurantiaca]|nr:toxin-antitoxin system YwqK family antitoxin [Runella aurantiaca]